MTDVAFKDLVLDANRPEVVAPFWGGLLGLADEALPDGDHRLTGDRPEQTVWVCAVPESLMAKSRVHLDVRLPADDTDVPGASLLRGRDEDIRWRVLADPDGLVLCAFGPREGSAEGAFELVVDAADPLAAAQWWADRTGATVHQRDGVPWVWLEGAAGFPFDYWVFNPVPEPKTVKNRVHWDVRLVDAGVEDLVRAGARVLREPDDEVRWTVLADPEGNEFCAFGD